MLPLIFEIFAVPTRAPEVQFPPLNETGVACTFTSQARAFLVVGPSVWNGLILPQRLLPRVHSDTFYSSLKTVFFSRSGSSGALLSSNLEEALHKSPK